DDRDDVRAIAIDPHGNVVVAARLRTVDSASDLRFAEYTPDGVLRWEQSWDDDAAGDDSLSTLRVTDDGRAYARVLSNPEGGYLNYVLVCEDEGNPLPDETIDLTDADAVVSDFRPIAGGDVLAAGVDNAGAIGAHLDATWEPVWATHPQGSAVA